MTSPVSGLPLQQRDIFPNHALRNAIEEYFQQVFRLHRRVIRKTVDGGEDGASAASSASLVRAIDALMQCSLLVNADLSIECILRRIMEEAKTLLGAEVASVFLLDAEHQELYSNVNSTAGEIRIPVSLGIAGHVARSGEALVVQDAYEDDRFDRTVDHQTGFRTRSILCVPIKDRKGGILGVAELINKSGCGMFADCRECNQSEELADGFQSFTPDDQNFFMVFASQAAIALANSGTLSMPPSPTGASVTRVLSLSPKAAMLHTTIPCEPAEPPAEEVGGATQALLREAAGSWQFDAFALAEASANQPLSTLGLHLFKQLGLVERFDLSESKLHHFLKDIELGYEEANPYHNHLHAASVLHVTHAILEHGGLLKAIAPAFAAKKDGVELVQMACLIAAAVHDFEHKGLSNPFLVKTGHDRAIRYNDHHVNENHHAAAAFDVLLRDENNFLEHLPTEDFVNLRNLVIELILGTDMEVHGKVLKSVTDAFAAPTNSTMDRRAATALLCLVLKCADLGHLTLPRSLHLRWVQRLEEELFRQGDKEKDLGMPVSFLMDRSKPGVQATQVGFLDKMALPPFRQLASLAPKVAPLLAAVEDNYTYWKAEEEAANQASRSKETAPGAASAAPPSEPLPRLLARASATVNADRDGIIARCRRARQCAGLWTVSELA